MPSNFSPAPGEFPALWLGRHFFVHPCAITCQDEGSLAKAVSPSGRCQEGDPSHSLGVIFHVHYPRSPSTAIFGRMWINVPVTMTFEGMIWCWVDKTRGCDGICASIAAWKRPSPRLSILIRGQYLTCFPGYQVSVGRYCVHWGLPEVS